MPTRPFAPFPNRMLAKLSIDLELSYPAGSRGWNIIKVPANSLKEPFGFIKDNVDSGEIFAGSTFTPSIAPSYPAGHQLYFPTDGKGYNRFKIHGCKLTAHVKTKSLDDNMTCYIVPMNGKRYIGDITASSTRDQVTNTRNQPGTVQWDVSAGSPSYTNRRSVYVSTAALEGLTRQEYNSEGAYDINQWNDTPGIVNGLYFGFMKDENQVTVDHMTFRIRVDYWVEYTEFATTPQQMNQT